MKKKLKVLEQLQGVDQEIAGKQEEQAGLTSEIAAMEQNIEQVRAQLKDLEGRMAALEVEKGQLEAALAAEQENVRRSETNMKEIRTNKEYQAVGKEIAAARKQINELEDQILAKTAASEELQQQLDAKADELGGMEKVADADKKEKQVVIAGIQAAVDTAKASRDALAKEVSSNVLRRYNQLREQRRGQALAEAREGSCLGCNMNLPPQLYNSLFKGDDLHFCPHCQRILFLRQEETQG